MTVADEPRRKTLDQMNSDDLDELHTRLERAEATTDAELRRQLAAAIEQLGKSETENEQLRRWLLRCSHREAIERVRDLADRWDNALAPDRTYARALRAALAAPEPAAAIPCPACRRADQAGLAPAEQHPACAKEQH